MYIYIYIYIYVYTHIIISLITDVCNAIGRPGSQGGRAARHGPDYGPIPSKHLSQPARDASHPDPSPTRATAFAFSWGAEYRMQNAECGHGT